MEKWYIILTRPRWEKKIADCFEQKGIESYCPVKRVKRQWSDRMKTLEEPLFKSCVLIKIASEQKTAVRLLDGVINFVYENGKPAQIKDKEVDMLKKALSYSVDQMTSGPHGEEKEARKAGQIFETYLSDFNQWLKSCMERPKLV